MDPLWIKIALMGIFFTQVTVFGRCISQMKCFQEGRLLSIAMTFSGGLFLSIALMDILPQASETFARSLSSSQAAEEHDNRVPFAEIIAMCTFMVIMLIDKILIGHSHDHEYEVSFVYEPRKSEKSFSLHHQTYSNKEEALPTPYSLNANVPHNRFNILPEDNCPLQPQTQNIDIVQGQQWKSKKKHELEMKHIQRSKEDKFQGQQIERQKRQRTLKSNTSNLQNEQKAYASKARKQIEIANEGKKSIEQRWIDTKPQEEEETHEWNWRPFILQIGMSIHSFFECLAVGLQRTNYGLLSLAGAILVHKWAEGLTLGLMYQKEGFSIRFTTAMIVLQGVVNVIGLIVGCVLSTQGLFLMAFFMSISAGTFLYISLAEVLFEQFKTFDRHKLQALILAVALISSIVSYEVRNNNEEN